MKKIVSVILVLAAMLMMLSACDNSVPAGTSNSPPNIFTNKYILTISGGTIDKLEAEEFAKLPQHTFEINRTNSKGVTVKAKYTGVKWGDLAKAIGAENATKVTLVGSDGYEQAYSIATLTTGNSLFANLQDGANISKSPLEGQVWFCADESLTANYWAKYVNKIIVE